MRKALTPLTLNELRQLYNERQTAILQRLIAFSNVPPSEYFYELVYCLLTPQSSAINADKAVHLLRQHDLLNADIDPEPLLHQKDFYIRFHKTKARHLINIKKQFPLIAQHLMNGSSSVEMREWVVKNVKGLGWKEASHFLRNIGHRNLAILDRHVLKNLIRLKVIRRRPKTMTPKRYKALEKKFQTFALNIGIPMDELDLLFWSMETGEIRK
ncbi:MAG: N-glycosylase/DNA lyase [Ignavibacteriae bacterium]|nr:N-glycosylase/DNA lyase [Ignavibacteriota bacterium]